VTDRRDRAAVALIIAWLLFALAVLADALWRNHHA
jgi:hypothetical protein